MIIEFEGQNFKSKKERDKYCYYNLKKLKGKYKQKNNWKEWTLIIAPSAVFFVLTLITNLLGFAYLAIFYFFLMLLFYKNKRVNEITSWAKDYEENYREEIERQKRMVQEYERKCRKCGAVWHSLKKDEENLISNQRLMGLAGLGTAVGGNLSASAQANRNAQASNDRLKDLKKCPKCGSQDYSEKITEFEKK